MKIRGTTITTPIKPEAVVVKCQNLTDEQKTQARENIGAVGHGENINLRGQEIHNANAVCIGIPSVDDGFYMSWETSTENYAVARFYGARGDEATILRGVAPGEEDWDAVTVAQLNTVVGDVETALDGIIAIQNSLIGGDAE